MIRIAQIGKEVLMMVWVEADGKVTNLEMKLLPSSMWKKLEKQHKNEIHQS